MLRPLQKTVSQLSLLLAHSKGTWQLFFLQTGLLFIDTMLPGALIESAIVVRNHRIQTQREFCRLFFDNYLIRHLAGNSSLTYQYYYPKRSLGSGVDIYIVGEP